MKKFLKIVISVIVAISVIGLTAWSERATTFPIVRTILAAWTWSAVITGLFISTQQFNTISRIFFSSLAGISMVLAFIPSFGIIPWVVKIICCLTVLAQMLFVSRRVAEVRLADNRILVK